MLVLAPAPDFWMAFHPETGGLYKVWHGKMDFRGKVWDFSQENSRADGRVYLAAPNEIWRLEDGKPTATGWTSQGVTSQKDGWAFGGDGSWLQSPEFDALPWHRVFLAFDETSRKGPFRVEVSDRRSPEVSQWFESATSAENDNSWQWNFKRVERTGSQMQVKITSQVPKRLRGLRMYGDQPVWFDGTGQPLTVQWKGYELKGQTEGVTISYQLQLASGAKVSVDYQPEVAPDGWTERFTLSGLPKGQSVYLKRPGLSARVVTESQLARRADGWVFSANGESLIRSRVQEESR